jgi:hypothetical protein
MVFSIEIPSFFIYNNVETIISDEKYIVNEVKEVQFLNKNRTHNIDK